MSRAKGKPPIMTLSAEQEREACTAIKSFMAERFELELGSFEAGEVLELFAREVAPHYYNRKRPMGAGKKLTHRIITT